MDYIAIAIIGTFAFLIVSTLAHMYVEKLEHETRRVEAEAKDR